MIAIAMAVFAFIFLAVTFSLIGAWITMWAWNIFVGGVWHGPTINFWQAFAANLLLAIISGIIKPNVTVKKGGQL
jgi:hypothetical protein